MMTGTRWLGTVRGCAWLIGFVGVAAVIAAVREWRIRSLEKQHGPDATS